MKLLIWKDFVAICFSKPDHAPLLYLPQCRSRVSLDDDDDFKPICLHKGTRIKLLWNVPVDDLIRRPLIICQAAVSYPWYGIAKY